MKHTTLPPFLGGLSVETFMRRYWQKKPLLVRRAFPDFQDPITPDELAGLSCEDGVESRIVEERGRAPRGRRGRPWQVSYGPQDPSIFAELPEERWTLLVQEVNRWVPEAALLLDRFSFVPNVRVDDVMVSYAVQGGSVGPHTDSYDVFLIQGQGERRWRFHTKPTVELDLVDGLELRILERFREDESHVLSSGDMLYIPPGFAHFGVAETPCLTYSIGFRAPSAAEAWASFAVSQRGRPGAERLIEDPRFALSREPGAIPEALRARVRRTVRSLDLSNEAIDRWYASFATQLKPGHELVPPHRPKAIAELLERLSQGAVVARSEEGRWAYLPRPKGALWLYVGGCELDVPKGAAKLARVLSSARRHDGPTLVREAKSREARALLERLFTMGALSFRRSA
jgi:50S ribosomal protein L16 3-hydroxylase